MPRALLTTITLLALAPFAQAQSTQPVPKSLKDSLLPASKSGGFKMPGQMLWCSSVMKIGDTYHLFASRWPAEHGMAGWTKYSECVRATSKNLLGPYTFEEVVLQKRPDKWDNSRVHNGKLLKIGNRFVFFYINSANQTGYATADAITGPWTRTDKYVINASNPAPFAKPDGSLYVLTRKKDDAGVNRAIAFTAPSYEGPYTPAENGANLLPDNAELEDPCIWWANNQYNVLLNDWKGKATGVSKGGAQYFSKDGVHYTLVSKEPVFTKTVNFDDGTTETFARRERPFVYTDETGAATALFTACLPTNGGPSYIVAQPIDHYVPKN